MSNKYYKHTKISEAKFRQLIRYFAMDFTATDTDELTGLSHCDEFANPTSHINGFESFWSLAKRRLTQFNGVPNHTYYLHLKELKFRLNHRHNSLYKVLLNFLKDVPALSSLLP